MIRIGQILFLVVCSGAAFAEQPAVRPAMSLVRADEVQPGGPAHDYRIGIFEITNAQFADFLNDVYQDAQAAPAHTAAAEFLYFDSDTGAVYLHDDQTPSIGPGAAGHTVPLFSPAVGGGIQFADGAYTVTADAGGVDYTDHPVVGVSWYGAVKFCNWLTLHHGMSPMQRAYTEGPTTGDWRPVSITAAAWALRDLDDAEREALVTQVAGYRLPMDDGANNVGAIDAADLYNEWYKAAAWNSAAGVARLYGFGRATLAQGDANYLASGDPFAASGTTPVGWYDGVHTLSGGGVTRNTANAFGLYDLCGNAAEWVQDHGSQATRRGLRGGHWQNSAASTLLDNLHRDGDLATAVRSYVGFRVAQSANAIEPMVAAAVCDSEVPCPLAFVGYTGGPYTPGGLVFEAIAGTDAPAEPEACATGSWLTLSSGEDCAESFLYPDEVWAVEANLDVAAADALTGVRPGPVDLQIVPPVDAQSDGPVYGFRIARTETTNAQYVEFLNDAIVNFGNARGAYLHVDTTSGVVYLSTTATGKFSSMAEPRLIRLFDPAVAGQVSYEAAAARYAAVPGYSSHPVAGISWLGAVKYCNWLTVRSGLATTDRAYIEGPNLGDWRPAAIAVEDWWGSAATADDDLPTAEARDLNDGERDSLTRTTKGFRLPMDGGAAGASPYNEWFKAAAFAGDVNTAYGFGDDMLAPGAANLGGNGDPFSPGATPAAFFDGSLYNPGGNGPVGDGSEFQTTPDANRYGLYDVTGNVAEWMQDAGDHPGEHAIRGGSFLDDEDSPLLRTDGRATLPTDELRADVGFRVAQAAIDQIGSIRFEDHATGDVVEHEIRLLVKEPIVLTPRTPLELTGYYGGPFAGDGAAYALQSASASSMSWQATRSAAWLDLNGSATVSGVLAPAGSTGVTVTANALARTRPPGLHTMTLTFRNQTTGYAEPVAARLTVAEPLAHDCTWLAAACPPDVLELTPSPVWNPGIPGGSPSFDWSYELSNHASVPIGYSLTTSATWLGFGAGQATGTLAATGDAGAQDQRSVQAMTTAAFASLAVGPHEATITIRNTTTNTTATRRVRVTVLDPLDIAGPDSANWTGPIGGPFTVDVGATVSFTISNRAGFVVDYSVSSTVPWVRLNGETSYAAALPPLEGDTVSVSLGDEALGLAAGVHDGQLTFTDLASGLSQTRTLRLTIGAGPTLTPELGLDVNCRLSGGCAPSARLYTLTNPADSAAPITWWAEVVEADPLDASWIRVNGDPIDNAGGSVSPGGTAPIVISIEAPTAVGAYSATLRLHHDGVIQGPPILRTITLSAVDPLVTDLDERLVPATAVQPSGPAYDFRITRHDITNAQFVAFLNDAIAHPGDLRGQYVYLDELTGDLYINTDAAGGRGEGPDGRTTKLFARSVGARIMYSAASDTYSPVSGFDDHPVVGVSWYGAVKFANWLTLDQGFPPSARCYAESVATDLPGWRPATITTTAYTTRDPSTAERAALVTGYAGYRLPMDQGSNNANPTVDAADAYNEWYKAAAWKVSANTLYGFGRNTIGPADANYAGGGHPVPQGTTPVGFYRAGSVLTSGIPANDTANAYGLYDMSGNVFQWVQDRQGAAGNDRALRGGSWSWPQGATGTQTARRIAAGPGSTLADTGFRVVRTAPPPTPGDASGDGVFDLADQFVLTHCLGGPAVTPAAQCVASDLDADGDVDLADAALLQRLVP